jgi:acyl-CoA dehydrogenase
MLSTLARGGGGGGGGVIVRMARRGVGFVNVGGSRGNMFSTLLEGMTTAGEKEEYTQIRESVRALCADFPGEYWRELDKVEEYPTEFVKAMTDSGFLSVLIPEEYGGSGLGLKAATVVLEEVHRSGCNAGAAHAQMYTMGSILHSGSDEQKERYLPDIAAGNLRLQAFGVSEPNSGTDTLSLETKAEQDANGDWLISGSKMWTSRAEHSDLMLLLARTGDGTGPRGKQLTTFLVDMRDQPGMEIKPVKTMMNHSSTAVFFDNVKVPKENVIGGVSNGFKTILKGMNAERVLIASECIGDGRYFVDKATAYSNERVVFGRPIGQNQGVQFPVAQAYCELEAAALMVNQAAEKFDRGEDIGAEANISKHLAAEASFKCGDVCIQTYGGFGFAREYDIERKFRETRLYRVAPISTNLVLSFVGEKLLGMPRSY